VLAGEIAGALEKAGYVITKAADFSDGLRLLYQACPNLVIIGRSLTLAETDDSFLRFRQASDVPIIVVGDGEDAVEMLESGVDAYINTPASPVELVARVRSMLRRQRNSPSGGIQEFGRGKVC
jgi:DNA-binding response OmpR family regulator